MGDDFDGAVFLSEDDERFDADRVQTGLESLEFIARQRFIRYFEKEIEDRLPVPAAILKKMAEKRKECERNPEGEECERLRERNGAQTPLIDFHRIPYEQKIGDATWIPFMFVSAVQFGPLFVRRNWWFNHLMPRLNELGADRLNAAMFDIEACLNTWALGGYVGLYDAEGFRFERKEFEKGLRRNERIDSEWIAFQRNHHLAQFADWNVWNVSHLVEKNENSQNKDLRLRTSANPTVLENSRQILLTLQSFEKAFDAKKKIKKDKKMMRLKKETVGE